MASTIPSYWCYRCSRFVRVIVENTVLCPDCGGGFVEEVETPSRSPPPPRQHRFPAAAMYVTGRSNARQTSNLTPRRSRTNAGDRSPFNPVIVLRGQADGGERGDFELYYDDGAGSGLRPIPSTMAELLIGSGFFRLLDQLAQLESNGVARFENPPASKAAIESMPTIKIVASHVVTEPHCAVCKDPFELGSEAREMPCKHIYHSDCILPWLSLRNSCPVCRHELPTDGDEDQQLQPDEETVGLTIWRLPGGGFAVGRFTGGRRAVERELPVVFTEMDGPFNNGGGRLPRRISWATRGSRRRESGGFSRVLRNFFSFFGRLRVSSSRSGSESDFLRRNRTDSIFNRSSRRRNHSWALEGNSGAIARW